MKKAIITLIIIGFTAGCARDFYTPYNEQVSGTGNATIKLSAAMRNVSVTMNDSLIVDGKYTKRVVINDIPVGKYGIKVIGTDGNRKSDLNFNDSLAVTPNSHKTVLIESPGLSTGYWIYTSLTFLAMLSVTRYVYY